MTIQDITEYLDKKINENENYVIIPVFEVRVTNGINESEVDTFLELARTRLMNLNYQVYFTNAEYTYKGERRKVQSNEYIVAIKEKEVDKNEFI